METNNDPIINPAEQFPSTVGTSVAVYSTYFGGRIFLSWGVDTGQATRSLTPEEVYYEEEEAGGNV